MKIIFSFLFLFSSIYIHAQHTNARTMDTLWVHVDQNEVAYININTKPGTTFYSLSTQFGLNISQLIAFNQNLKTDELDIGDQIKIPFDDIRESLNSTLSEKETFHVCYRVRPKDNLFRISRIYLHMKKKALLEVNNLKHHSLSINQVLTIGYLPKTISNFDPIAPDSTSLIPVEDSTLIESQGNILRTPMDEYEENDIPVLFGKGVAFWDKKAEKSKRYYVLHPSAKLHSLIEIINPMNERKVFAKVVGNIPQNAYTSDIQLVVSSAVTKKLGVLDSRFYATYRYIQ